MPLPNDLRQQFRFPANAKIWVITWTGTGLLLLGAFFALPDFHDFNQIPSAGSMLVIAVVAFCTPALLEEFVFRYLLNRSQTAVSMTLSTLAFIAWHPLGAWLFLHRATPWFTDPGFLTFVGLYGAFSCLLRKWSNSLWPSILSHWVVVLVWKGLGGAQFLT